MNVEFGGLRFCSSGVQSGVLGFILSPVLKPLHLKACLGQLNEHKGPVDSAIVSERQDGHVKAEPHMGEHEFSAQQIYGINTPHLSLRLHPLSYPHPSRCNRRIIHVP